MPKQLRRGHAARNPTSQVPEQNVHSRHLHDVAHDAADSARLRGVRNGNHVAVHTRDRRDTVIRRLFSRDDIVGERNIARAALARAAMNVTPERLSRMGSPGRQAVLCLQHASGIDVRHDVKVGQIRKAAALLASGGKKRSFRVTPTRMRSSRLAQAGASALAANGARRVQLRKFCTDSAVTRDLPALLRTGADQPEDIPSCIAIFKSAALSYILAEMKGQHADQKNMMRQLQAATDSPLLRLFLKRWIRAKLGGQINEQKFPWVEAVDWLVRALRDAKPLSPGATRAPRSPRVASPKAAPAPSPAKPVRAGRRALLATQSIPTSSSTRPTFAAPSRSLTARQKMAPAYVLAPPMPLQSGRQAVSRRVQSYLESPTRLASGPAPRGRKRRQTQFSATPAASLQPPAPAPADQAKAATASSRPPPARTLTLLDIVMQEFEASLVSAATTDGTASNADTNGADSGGSESASTATARQ